MTIFDAIKLVGGLAIFLFGMTTMANGLEKVAGSKLEGVLKKLTKTPLLAVIFGAVLTAAIQSSSATTVMVVGLVNSGLMQLSQAIGVIMGANIGTTVTAQILSLGDIDSDNMLLLFLKPATIAPIFSCIGAFLFMFSKNEKRRNWGQVGIGFGVLFTGMFTMEGAVAPLRDSPVFAELFSTLQNPILGVLVGAGVTAIIQSSSASVGILQALSSTGVISYATAIPIILGQNIGTCITPMMASIGASKAAKRSAFCHLYFNIIGTSFFLLLVYLSQYLFDLPFWTDIVDRGDIANFHTIFNVAITLMLLPFTKLLAKLAMKTVPDSKDEKKDDTAILLDERLLATPTLAIQQVESAVAQMAKLAYDNYKLAIPLVFTYSDDVQKNIIENEALLDRMEVETTNYLIQITHKELTEEESDKVSALLHILSDFERIGDRVENVVDWAHQLHSKSFKLSQKANDELTYLGDAVGENIELAISATFDASLESAKLVEPLEETVDKMCAILRAEHLNRLKAGDCNIETGIIYIELISDFERISDYCSSIAGYVMHLDSKTDYFDNHLMKSKIKTENQDEFTASALAKYEERYIKSVEN